MLEISALNKMKSLGPSTDPWETPLVTFDQEE